jgi:hypothetical protein
MVPASHKSEPSRAESRKIPPEFWLTAQKAEDLYHAAEALRTCRTLSSGQADRVQRLMGHAPGLTGPTQRLTEAEAGQLDVDRDHHQAQKQEATRKL